MATILTRLSLAAAQRTVWVFGAGASAGKPYSVPLQAKLLSHFDRMGKPGRPAMQQKLEEVRARVRDHCRRVFPGVTDVATDGAKISLEEVFSAFELERDDLRSTAEEHSNARAGIEDLRRALRFTTSTHGRGDSKKWAPHARGRVSSPYAELLEHLAPLANPEGDLGHVLVTFNYDVNLDRCAINLVDVAERDVDYGIPFSNERCSGAPEFRAPRLNRRLLLLRTHGSLNWIRCRACQSVFSMLNRHATVTDTSKCYACRARALDYVLVHPSYSRRYDDPLLRLVWGRTFEEMTRADRWVFIGYSLPSADFHFRELLRASLRERAARSVSTEVVLVGRAGDGFDALRSAYEGFFGGHLKVWEPTAAGFGDFVRRLDP